MKSHKKLKYEQVERELRKKDYQFAFLVRLVAVSVVFGVITFGGHLSSVVSFARVNARHLTWLEVVGLHIENAFWFSFFLTWMVGLSVLVMSNLAVHVHSQLNTEVDTV